MRLAELRAEAGALELVARTRARTPHSSTCTPRAFMRVEEALEQREADGVGIARALHAQHDDARRRRRRAPRSPRSAPRARAVAPKNISPSRPKTRMRAQGASSGRRSWSAAVRSSDELGEQHPAGARHGEQERHEARRSARRTRPRWRPPRTPSPRRSRRRSAWRAGDRASARQSTMLPRRHHQDARPAPRAG